VPHSKRYVRDAIEKAEWSKVSGLKHLADGAMRSTAIIALRAQ